MSIIIPASNEAGRIGPCLDAVIASEWPDGAAAKKIEIVVVANGCDDGTEAEAEARRDAIEARGWRFDVQSHGPLGKLDALNEGDFAAAGGIRVYLDADVIVSPPLLSGIDTALRRDNPRYASGQVNIPESRSWVTRQYARFYWRVPFMTHGVPGCGLFAMNASGRDRWGKWPDIISDDTFARLHFTPGERFGVAASYDWPLVEGWRQLVRVRQRQNAGVDQIARRYPELLRNDDKPRITTLDKINLALRDPVGAMIYGGVALQVRLMTKLGLGRNNGWARGR